MATDYINEHELALLLSVCRNCKKFGEPPRELSQEHRKIFDENVEGYFHAMEKTKGDKRNAKVQEHFKAALESSPFCEPTDGELSRLYELVVLLAKRCLRTFSRNSPLNEDELGSIVFARWIRYRENFDPLKKSKISGLRVNAFAYMTQVIKNVIYEEYNKTTREMSSELLPPNVIHDIEDPNELQELEECRNTLIKESLRCYDFAKCLRGVSEKYELSPDIIIKTIIFYDLRPEIEKNIQNNVWDF